MSDLIDRQAAIDALEWKWAGKAAFDAIKNLPSAQPDLDEWCHDCKEYDKEKHSCPRWNRVIRNTLKDAQPEIIRCKDCRWWDKYDEWDNGYCMAAKHGYLSEHWEITIRRTYKGDFYCADAEPKGEYDDEVEEEDEGEHDG